MYRLLSFVFLMKASQAIPLLKAAWGRGINTIDTADVYSQGESERIIGKFIKQVRQTLTCNLRVE